MKAIVFDEFGSPADDFAALRLEEVPIPEIGDDEVLVRMVAASINPGDFLFIQNLYPEPKKPVFPRQIAGTHGVGIIAKAGGRVTHTPGTLVYFSYDKAWAEYAAVPAEWVIPLPSDYPVEKAAQFFNLITAWDLLEESGVKPGEWLALTAGNSTVAAMVTQFAKRRGVKVISIVRQAQESLNLKALGAAEVIELSKLSKSAGERIVEITDNQGLHGVVDSVGGPVAGELIRSLAMNGQAVIYGGYSAETFQLHNFDILLRNVSIKPHIFRYFFVPPQEEDAKLLQTIAKASAGPDFHVPVGGMHALDDFRSAIHTSIHQPERGKRFFRMHS